MKSSPDWMDTPIVAKWNRGIDGGVPLLNPVDIAAARSIQIERARQLGAAFGIRRVTDTQAQRIASSLSSHVPGLRVVPPSGAAPIDDFRWVPPNGGRPLEWTDKDIGELAWAVERLQTYLWPQARRESKRAPTIKSAVVLLHKMLTAEHEAGRIAKAPPGVRGLQNLVSQASRRNLWSPPESGLEDASLDAENIWNDPPATSRK